MFKKILGGVLLCGLLVPVSVVLSITEGVSLILECVTMGIKMISKPLSYKVMELITGKTKTDISRKKHNKSCDVLIES